MNFGVLGKPIAVKYYETNDRTRAIKIDDHEHILTII